MENREASQISKKQEGIISNNTIRRTFLKSPTRYLGLTRQRSRNHSGYPCSPRVAPRAIERSPIDAPEIKRASGQRSTRLALVAMCVTAMLMWLPICAAAANPQGGIDPLDAIHPSPRVTDRVNDAVRVRISDSTPRGLSRAKDLGRMDGGTKMGPLFLILKSSPKQEHTLQQLLDEQQDKSTSNYHYWLTPDEFGTEFGVDENDIQQAAMWLTAHGFEVKNVAPGNRSIEFQGTVAEVDDAFHTQMHYYEINGKRRFSNNAAISVPSAFGPVVSGVVSLNNFSNPEPPYVQASSVRPAINGSKGPSEEATSGSLHLLSPGDFAVIYNTQPLLEGETGGVGKIDGNGQTIGVVGVSHLNKADITAFRQIFLPSYNANNTNICYVGTDGSCDGPDPGANNPSSGWDEEAAADVEWTGAVAPRATILYAASEVTADDLPAAIYNAASYIVDSNSVSVLSVSAQTCEADLTFAENQAFYALWEQAAAQGITVLVAATDSGSAGCDDYVTEKSAIDGYAVNGFASTPYNVAVGGTMFNENGDSNYWSTTNYNTQISNLAFTSALSYIPENAWNESAAGNDDLGGIWAGGGGISSCYAKPAWQVGPEVPSQDLITPHDLSNSSCSAITGPHRYLPDVSVSAASHDGYVLCNADNNYDCISNGTTVSFPGAGVNGTSVATPAFAGIQALMDQQYGRQGQANYVYYQLAAAQTTDGYSCDSTLAGGPHANCIFNDVTVGSNRVPCQVGTPDCSASPLQNFGTATGYDMATGLGSVNALNLFLQWDTATPVSTSFTLAVSESGQGTVTSNPAGISCTNGTGTCQATFDSGASVALSASAATGWTFSGWSGGGCSGNGICTVAMNSSQNVTATFTQNSGTYTLAIIDSGQGTVTSSDGKIDCNYNVGTCNASYSAGTVVTLNETPASGWTFSGWSGACSGTGACSVTIDTSGIQYVTASFTQSGTTYTLAVSESGQGTVTSNPVGISCTNGAGSCQATFDSGASVTLSAVPASGWTFSGWSGGGCSGTGSCNVAMSSSQTITANFSQTATRYTLSVVDSGQGAIASADTLINCTNNAGTCQSDYPAGSIVTLNAIPAGGWLFTGWNNPCSGTGSCLVAMNSNQTVTANFTQGASGGFSISGQVTYDGGGLGGVTMSLSEGTTASTITDSSGNYTFSGLTGGKNYLVTPSLSGYTFSPGGEGFDPLNADESANFTAAKATYTVTVTESGQGTVTSSDGAINCTNGTGSCSAGYTSGTTVTLSATSPSGWQFYGWSGACNGTSDCTLSVDGNKAVSATFSQASGPLVALPAFTPGLISAVAGDGITGDSGDGGAATSADMNTPLGVAVSSQGIIYIADFDNNRVRAANTGPTAVTVAGVTIQPGAIATIAGNGTGGFQGDGGPPTSAGLWGPVGLALDSVGDLYITDADNERIRVINTQASVATILGTQVQPGTIMTVAGNGAEAYSGDNGPATQASLANPQGLAFDAAGNLYIADMGNNRIRKVTSAGGVITTVAGSSGSGSDGDGQPATNAHMEFPDAAAVDAQGNIYIAETNAMRIRVVYEGGTVPGLSNPQVGYLYTLAGAGTGCTQQTDTVGDGCPSVDAGAIVGEGLALDPGGSLYIADFENSRLRRIDRATGIITTVAGDGTSGYSGDGGSATTAELSFDSEWYGNILAIDPVGNIYFGDGSNNRVRLVSAAAAPVTFPSTSLGQASPVQTVTLQNDGNAALVISSFAITGSDAGDFAQSNTCPVSPNALAAGASCSISLTFTPAQSGARTATLNIADNASSLTQTIGLSGSTAGSPTLSTLAASGITSNSAVLEGSVNPNGQDTQVWFSYGTDPALSSNVLTTPPQDAGSGSSTASFNANVSALAPGTTYYFQASASNSAGTVQGSILQFATTASNAPAASLSTTSLSFGDQLRGQASSAQDVTLKSTGNAPLTISNIAVTGTDNADFEETNTCGSSINAGANCTIAVTFDPTLGGSRSGSLTISDNGADSPQTVALSGVGEDFALGPASGAASSETVTAGASTSYSLNVSPEGGFNQAVTLACTGAPQGSTCTVSPASVTLDGSNAAPVKVSVTTASGSLTAPPAPDPPSGPPVILWIAMLGLAGLAVIRFGSRRARPRLALFGSLAVLLISVAVCVSCGGGAGAAPSPSSSSSNATPAGTYTLTVTGASGSLSHSTALTLKVQ